MSYDGQSLNPKAQSILWRTPQGRLCECSLLLQLLQFLPPHLLVLCSCLLFVLIGVLICFDSFMFTYSYCNVAKCPTPSTAHFSIVDVSVNCLHSNLNCSCCNFSHLILICKPCLFVFIFVIFTVVSNCVDKCAICAFTHINIIDVSVNDLHSSFNYSCYSCLFFVLGCLFLFHIFFLFFFFLPLLP